MARNDDAERIAPNGLAYLVGRGAVSQFGGQLTVCLSLAIANAGEQIPHSPPARVAYQCDWKIELGALAGEVLAQLLAGAPEQFVGSRLDVFAENLPCGRVPMMPEVHARQSVAVGGECQLTQWAIDHRVSCCHRSASFVGRR